MTTEVLSSNNEPLSIEQATNMFDTLFTSESNRETVVRLFEWIPGLARAQQVNAVITSSKEEISDLRNTV